MHTQEIIRKKLIRNGCGIVFPVEVNPTPKAVMVLTKDYHQLQEFFQLQVFSQQVINSEKTETPQSIIPVTA